MRAVGAHIAPAVLFARRHVRYRTRTQIGAAPGDRHFERSLPDHDHFFVDVMVRRMRRQTRSELGQVQLDRKCGMRFALEDGARPVRPRGADRQIRKRIGLRQQRRVLRGRLGR